MNKSKTFLLSIVTNKKSLLVLLVFILEIFLRLYNVDKQNPFGWDQVDNAWTAKNMIINHWYPLVGMVAKQNSGFYIGPLYYYLIKAITIKALTLKD